MLATASSADNRRGILAMLVGMGLFVVSDATMKLASAHFPTGQMLAVRGAFASALVLVLVVAMGEAHRLRALAQPFVAGRALIESVIAFMFISALATAPLADLTAILQAAPIIVTLLLVVLGLERVGWRRWAAILVGFAGVLLIVRPGPEGFDTSALLALAAAILVAGRDLVTRLIHADVPSIVVVLGTTAMVAIVGPAIGLALGEEWRPVLRAETLILVGAACLYVLANIAIVTAFRKADVSVVAPFRYASVAAALVVGFLVFGEFPDAVALSGFALVVGAGIYSWHRERIRRDEALDPSATTHQPAASPRRGDPA
ncbi:DMT family transporter [Salinarimonas ramus]|uniref:Membrane protein n=1 Tax=Salinarimonas ramus TaxID=690164 RepID=A0A917Q985_9HYPH|nr:DMT family transporter [Salinarimonas ramus]GGK37202.1 membrane protein [Salinarimonas ramus]